MGDTYCFDVRLTTKYYAIEISWSLGSCSSNKQYEDYQDYTQECCLPLGSYTLKCKDSYNDGWHGGFVEVDGVKYCETFSGSVMKNEIVVREPTSCTNTSTCNDDYYCKFKNTLIGDKLSSTTMNTITSTPSIAQPSLEINQQTESKNSKLSGICKKVNHLNHNFLFWS